MRARSASSTTPHDFLRSESIKLQTRAAFGPHDRPPAAMARAAAKRLGSVARPPPLAALALVLGSMFTIIENIARIREFNYSPLILYFCETPTLGHIPVRPVTLRLQIGIKNKGLFIYTVGTHLFPPATQRPRGSLGGRHSAARCTNRRRFWDPRFGRAR